MLARVKESGPVYPVTVAGLDFVRHEWRWFPDERQSEFENHPFLMITLGVGDVVDEPDVEVEPEVLAVVDEPNTAETLAEVNATASALALAETHGLDLTDIFGSGAGGRITKSDVEALL